MPQMGDVVADGRVDRETHRTSGARRALTAGEGSTEDAVAEHNPGFNWWDDPPDTVTRWMSEVTA
jgi:hypothetical protein